MKKQGHLYFIMGVSGAGKGTLLANLRDEKEEKYQFVKSYVTRRMRPGEENGDIYWFISNDEFEKGIEQDEFLEYEINHKVAYYGTKIAEVENGLDQGMILIKEIDTKGLIQLNEKHPEFRKNYSSVFLDVPDEVLRERFFERNPGGKEDDLLNRLESAIFERKQAQEHCDYILDASESREEVLDQLKKIIQA